MFTLIEAANYRCLKHVHQAIGEFHVLVGPNASGKTTFLDVLAFLGRLVSDGLDAALDERTQDYRDLIWGRKEGTFELAVEASIPEERRVKLDSRAFECIRYEVSVGRTERTAELAILSEKALLKKPCCAPEGSRQLDFFPSPMEDARTILTPKGLRGTRTVVNKVAGGNDNFYDETEKGWDHSFKLGAKKSALGNLPDDESKFPASTWLKQLLIDGVQPFILNSLLIRKASPPGQKRGFKPDGSNLPWVVAELEKRHRGAPHSDRGISNELEADRGGARREDLLRDWIEHLQTALPELEGLRTVEREDDKHRYLMLRYKGDLEIPSWVASDGTLRLLALTLPAYLPNFSGVYLIEEPENGIHPRAVETMFQSLSSTYDAQILMATHSPVILSTVEPEKVLCFAKDSDGATRIVPGDKHPALRDWRGETNLGVLFAAGVLG